MASIPCYIFRKIKDILTAGKSGEKGEQQRLFVNRRVTTRRGTLQFCQPHIFMLLDTVCLSVTNGVRPFLFPPNTAFIFYSYVLQC